jgi:hypothetical protein
MVKIGKNAAITVMSWDLIEMPRFFNVVFMEED